VLIEAMASAIPVVALASRPVAEVVTQTTGVLVHEKTSDAFATGIEAVYEQGLLRLGANARGRAQRHWNMDALMRGLVDRYARLVAS
jgi:alpha-1,6-mannosyltransferase